MRRALLELGVRGFDTNARDLPGSPDIAIRRSRQAIFVHGCFWHVHPECAATKLRGIHSDFWREKLARNVLRDRRAVAALEAMGWKLLIIWECEALDAAELRRRLREFLTAYPQATHARDSGE